MKKFLSFIAVAFLATVGAVAQEQQLHPLPIDPEVRMGVLDNGLTYYIRHNEQPKERCEFHIAQAVGAILEEDHQNGLAHFLEHMAFNGTEHFPGKKIIEYFESVGVSFGRNINAYTSLDETVYRLSDVPTYREGILDSALLVMYDWSCAISLLGEEIDSERGVIREEWRTGNTAPRRMFKYGMQYKFPGSQYAKRDVIGDTAVINNFSYQALRDYYHLWYGPDLQAIVVVGDIDVDKMEQKLVKLFNTAPERKTRPEGKTVGVRPRFPIADNQEPIVALYKDNEAQYSMIEAIFKHPALPREITLSQEGYVYLIINQLIQKMISFRFEDIVHNPDANLLQGFGYYGNVVGVTDGFQFRAIAKDGKEKEALRDLLTQVEKINRYGFTNAELERAKTALMSDYESYYNERNTRTNQSLAEEYYRHYLDAQPIPGIETEYEIVKMIVPQLPVEVVSEAAKAYITEENVVLSFLGKDLPSVPSKEEMSAIYNEVKASEIEAPVEESFDRPLVDKTPKAGKIKKESYNDKLGTTEWTLSNGIRVIIKPTTFKNDEIQMVWNSEGGLSKVAVNDLPSADLATSVVSFNGIGDFSMNDLRKVLTGKNVGLQFSINNYVEEVHGSSSIKDLETLLQLTNLYFTSPRKDDQAYQTLMSMLESQLSSRDSDPKAAFQDSINMVSNNHHERVIIENLDFVKRVDQDRAIAIYKERFENPADFIVTFVGNIDPKDPATRQLICTWLGSLKTSKKREHFVDNGVRFPEGKVENYFEREMQINTASNRIMYTGKMDYTLANNLNMSVIGDILSTRYLESIREKEGGSYGVGVYGYVTNRPINQAVLLMQFDTDPLKQEKLMSIIHKEVMEIIENGPRADDLAKVKESMLKDHAENLEKNEYWMNAIMRYYTFGIDNVNDYKAAVEAITAETVQSTLKALVEQGNVLEVVMSPKK